MKNIYLLVIIFIASFFVITTPVRAQFGSTLGSRSVSTLAWKQIETTHQDLGGTIGVTTDGRVYTWGTNYAFTINSGYNSIAQQYLFQTTPYYVPFPAGEVVKKVGVTNNVGISLGGKSGYVQTFFALSESGKLYAWGGHNGLLGTAWTALPDPTSLVSTDSSKTKRLPVQLTIMGESSFVDFDVPSTASYWIAIGASGKAYHNGSTGGNPASFSTTYATLPNPTGVDVSTFKYTNVWVEDYTISSVITNSSFSRYTYLKGNNGKIYFTGNYQSNLASGVPLISNVTSALGNSPFSDPIAQWGQLRDLVPVEVPFPAGEDIIAFRIPAERLSVQKTYALSSSGKAYVTGVWKRFPKSSSFANSKYAWNTQLSAPLKNVPALADLMREASSDSIITLKKFTEVAPPPGGGKILDIIYTSEGMVNGTIILTDNNKAFWSGVVADYSLQSFEASNYLNLSHNDINTVNSDVCLNLGNAVSGGIKEYNWSVEAINLEGAKQISRVSGNVNTMGAFLIDQSNRGYYLGRISPVSGLGKLGIGIFQSPFPMPLANEQLLSCQISPGTGGPLAPVTPPTNTAVGVIDCSKTQLSPAPTAGTASQLDLIVSINVTTAGTFTPITVSGSGMTVANGITSVSTATTGIQTFHIPMNYDGTALGTLNFTIGSAGSCTADLSGIAKKKVISEIWTLDNCTLQTVAPDLK